MMHCSENTPPPPDKYFGGRLCPLPQGERELFISPPSMGGDKGEGDRFSCYFVSLWLQ